ncbi:5-oxoprolinase subunit C family protein [Planctomonas psychrotolerans]|uniref:5-oxoprolinase subunit C family protein n=1 Tax=Planctomonas psychrotolerans TaxID=2528712 RepID=UPI00123A4B3E|nr:biotin-dependent carboxyltransferase family protein [Planctomonas psychrotolerans]
MTAFDVLDPGPLLLIEDLGRPGSAHLGVPPSGAMDRASLRLANRLVGNAEGTAALEILAGGARLRARGPHWVAVTGAWGDVRTDGRPLPVDRAVLLPHGAILEFPVPDRGLRYYLAVRGGIGGADALGSRSTDVLSGIGPDPLLAGDVLVAGPVPALPVPPIDEAFTGPPLDGLVRLRLRPGPRTDWFAPGSMQALVDGEWRVSPASNRVGVRLEGEPLRRVRDDELPSEGMVAGALQVPPSGLPTILAADHPVTGGYPVIAVLVDADLDALGQLRPGQPVRFTRATGFA